MNTHQNYQDANAAVIDRWITEGWEWGKPVDHETYINAQNGQWSVVLTPTKAVPREWFGDLKGKKRTKNLSFPRQVAMYLAREMTEFSTTEIGVELGGRDHSTVMHGHQKIETQTALEPSLEVTIAELKKRITNSNQ